MEKNELFFDRHAASFATVINFYRTGKVTNFPSLRPSN